MPPPEYSKYIVRNDLDFDWAYWRRSMWTTIRKPPISGGHHKDIHDSERKGAFAYYAAHWVAHLVNPPWSNPLPPPESCHSVVGTLDLGLDGLQR